MQADFDWALQRLDEAKDKLRTSKLAAPDMVPYWSARVSELEDLVSDMLSELDIL